LLKAVDLPDDIREAYEEVLSAIESVHGVGDLPAIDVMPESVKGRNGGFTRNTEDGRAWITIGKNGLTPSHTLAHEIGHFLDYYGLGGNGLFGSEANTELMGEWLKAVKNSQALADLKRLKASKATKEYYLSSKEVWARSYAQYITTRSGSAKLGNQLTFNRGFGTKGALWKDDDFEPIAKAMDGIFRALGWLK